MKNQYVRIVLALIALCLASTGCVYRTYKEGDTEYTSLAIATKQGVAPFTLEAGAKGEPGYRKLESKGLSNDPSADIVGAAVKAAVEAAK